MTPTPTQVGGGCVLAAGEVGIHNEAEFRGMSDPAGRYKLCSNITLTSPISPLFGGEPFTGSFDGQGRTISGLQINASGQMIIGLTAVVGRNGSWTNTILSNPQVSGGAVVGGFTGINGGNLSGLSVQGGSITATTSIAGALAGISSGGTLSGTSSAQIVVNGQTQSGSPLAGLQN